MRPKSFIIYGLISITVLSCRDDGNFEPYFLKDNLAWIDNRVTSLEGAKLYLTDSYLSVGYFTHRERKVRVYTITDGTYTNYQGSHGFSHNDYDDETYFIVFKFSADFGEALVPGEFPLYPNFEADGWESNGPNCKIYWEVHYDRYSQSDFDTNHPPIVVSGGLDNGNELTISFEGALYRWFNNITGGGPKDNVKTKINYTGTVIDAR